MDVDFFSATTGWLDPAPVVGALALLVDSGGVESFKLTFESPCCFGGFNIELAVQPTKNANSNPITINPTNAADRSLGGLWRNDGGLWRNDGGLMNFRIQGKNESALAKTAQAKN